MREATEIYFGGRIFVNGIQPRTDQEVKFLEKTIRQYAEKCGFELTDSGFVSVELPSE